MGADRSRAKMPLRGSCFAAIGALTFSVAAPLGAQEIDPDPRFWAEGGVYFPDTETTVALSLPDSNNGTEISLEDDLGFDSGVDSFDLTVGAKLDDDFFIEASFFDLDRTTTFTLDRTITVEDAVFDVGAAVGSEFSSQIYRVTIGYKLISDPKWDLSVALGAHLTDFTFGIAGAASVNGAGVSGVERGQDFLAPLPTIVGQAKVRPIRWLELRGRADYLDLTIDQYNGRLINLEASATAAITNNIAVGAAYRYTDYRLDIDATRFDGRVEYEFDGPRVFLRVSL